MRAYCNGVGAEAPPTVTANGVSGLETRPTRGLALFLGLVLAAGAAWGQEEGVFRTVFTEDWERYEAGPLLQATGAWEVMQQTDTEALVEEVEGGKALRIVDDHVAREDATCRLRRRIGRVRGRSLVTLRMMVTQGDAGGVNQDMGLNLYDGGRLLLNVFFSGGELKTWQGPTWTSLEPPVPWEDGKWYDIELLLDPGPGTVQVTVDGESHGTVKMRTASDGLSMVEVTSQRSARGETWCDDLEVAYEVPAELRAQPSEAWEKAGPRQRQTKWFADEGSRLAEGALASGRDGLTSMRRLVTVDMAMSPLLCMEAAIEGDSRYTLYAAPVGGGVPELVELRSQESGRREYDLFALTGWQGSVEFELLASARGEGRLRMGDPELEEMPPNEYLTDPDAVWRFVRRPRPGKRLDGEVPLRVQGMPGEGPRRAHVSQGIPFAEGAVSRVDGLLLKQGDDLMPTQRQVLSVWGDGSVRWLLVDGLVDLPASGEVTVALVDTGGSDDGPTVATQTGDLVRLETGELTLDIPASSYGPITGMPAPLNGEWDLVGAFGGSEFRASQGEYAATVEMTGTVRGTVVIRGTLSDGVQHPFRYELRWSAVRGVDELELAPTFTLVTDAPEVQLKEMTLLLGGTPGPGAVTFGGDDAVTVERSAGGTAKLLQDTREHYAVTVGGEEQATGEHAAGWLSSDGATVAARRFWQQFAKGSSVSDEGFRVELWSPDAPARRFGRGAAKTHQVLISLGASEAALADFEHPPTLYPGAEWYFETLGLGHFPIPSDEHAEMDAIFEAALEQRLKEQQRLADVSYGMVHYGDINHINSEIDAYKAFFMQWARTGERKWLDFTLDATLHSQDIDVCHYSPDPREVGIHHSHYPSDHNNGGLTLTHTWIEAQLFRYYVTGDRRSLMAADLAGRAFSRSMLTSGQMFDAGNKGAGIGSRAYGRACWALCELYRATHNPRYLWAMERLTGFLIAGLREDGAVGASHDGSGNWNAVDECPHFAAICAVGLARYSELSGDRTVLEGLERIAKWQMSRGAMPEKLGIMYHNYQGGEVIHFVDACADMLEAWAYLYDETGNPLYRDFAESVYDNMTEMNDRWRRDWTMGLRSVLFYLGRRDKWAPYEPSASAPTTEATVSWLQSCRNNDGGFGVAPGFPSDMDSTFRAVDALVQLGAAPGDVQACIGWVTGCRNEDGGYAGEPGWHSNVAWTWLALATLERLGVEPPERDATVRWLIQSTNDDGGTGASPVTGKLAYHAAWNSSTEYSAYKAQALGMLGAGQGQRQGLVDFLRGRQKEDGGFPHRGGAPATGYTLDAVQGLAALNSEPENPEVCAEWLAGLRQADGGYGWPRSGRSTLRNTAHCALGLEALGVEVEGADETARYVESCGSAEGGYGHAPGRAATVTGTWYAVKVLGALE